MSLGAEMGCDSDAKDDRKWAIHDIAIDIVMNRRSPSHPELMQSDDAILNFLSNSYPTCVHGYSTTMMVCMFRFEYILDRVPTDEVMRIISYVYTGRPIYRSANDGVRTP